MSGTNSSISLLQLDTEITTQLLCDDGNANASFVRVTERTYDNGVPTGAPTVTDVETDFVTPYVIVGNAITCPSPDYEVIDETLCDSTGTEFIRRFAFVNGVQVLVGDFELDGVTAYVAVGAVSTDCANAVVDPIAGGVRLVGPTTLTLVTGTYRSFSISVTAGPLESASLTIANAPSLYGGNFVPDYIMPRGYSGSWDVDASDEKLGGGTDVEITVPVNTIVMVATTI